MIADSEKEYTINILMKNTYINISNIHDVLKSLNILRVNSLVNLEICS